MINNIINYIKNNPQKLFCYFLIFAGILLFILVFLIKPHKLTSEGLYSITNPEDEYQQEITFPIEQKITISKKILNGIYLYLGEDDINSYPYTVTLKDEEGTEYFNHYFNLDYDSNIIYIGLPLTIDTTKEFLLTIDCQECKNVELSVMDANQDNTHIVGNDDKTLKLSIDYYKKNNNYYWYTALSIVIGLTLLTLARRKEQHD